MKKAAKPLHKAGRKRAITLHETDNKVTIVKGNRETSTSAKGRQVMEEASPINVVQLKGCRKDKQTGKKKYMDNGCTKLAQFVVE